MGWRAGPCRYNPRHLPCISAAQGCDLAREGYAMNAKSTPTGAPGAAPGVEERVLVLAPTGDDAALVGEVFGRIGLPFRWLAGVDELCAELAAGAGMAILAEEALEPWALHKLLGELGRQEPWSDLPLIVLAGASSGEGVLAALGPHSNATTLERPVRGHTLGPAALPA